MTTQKEAMKNDRKAGIGVVVWLVILLTAILGIFAFATNSDPWDGTGWDVAAPDIDQPIGKDYLEIQDLRKGIAVRMNKEHQTLASGSAGGEHIPGGCAIMFYDDTAAVDANVTASTFVHDGLIYDTDLLQFFTMNAAASAKVAMTIGTAGIADANITTDKIADANITTALIADANVTTAKIADDAVTFAKLGCEVDEDDMSSDSDELVPTQQSVVAYLASAPNFTPSSYGGEESVTLPNGLIIKQGTESCSFTNSATNNSETFSAAFPTACTRVILTYADSNVTNNSLVYSAQSLATSGFTIRTYSNNTFSATVAWIAIGY